MKIGFDYQGTLDVSPQITDMMIELYRSGWQVVILSAMPENRPDEREKQIEEFIDNLGWQIPYVVVYHSTENYHKSAGEAKVKYLKERYINFYVDDNPEVCKIMKEAGITVLQVL